ncbi:hypothetical protein [Streptomyces rubiginosohelvolus]|uniref:Uncharacterized protein n=1 Tax=Streptomyces rubiginosohelvolus TaxID=67362 RepID=A0ABW6EWQ1_9ACTN
MPAKAAMATGRSMAKAARRDPGAENLIGSQQTCPDPTSPY